jgi:hypothetical protein
MTKNTASGHFVALTSCSTNSPLNLSDGFNQGTLTEGEGSVQLTSLLRQVVL